MQTRKIDPDIWKIKEYIDNRMLTLSRMYRESTNMRELVHKGGEFAALEALNSFIHKNEMLNVFKVMK